MLSALAKTLFGSENDRVLKKMQASVDAINALEPELEKLSDEELVAIFNAVDEEGEGEILFNDFLTLMVVLMENDTEEKNLITAFESLDKGNTGLISVKHVHDILKTIGEQMTSTEIDKFISVADSDNDGMVDIVDIKRMLL